MTEDDREELPFVTSVLRGAGFQLHAPASWRGVRRGCSFHPWPLSTWSYNAFFFLLTSDLNCIYALWIYHLSLSGVGSCGSILQQTCTLAPVVHKGPPNKCISSTLSWLQFLPQSFCCFLPIFLAGLPSCQLIVWAIQHSFNKSIFPFY